MDYNLYKQIIFILYISQFTIFVIKNKYSLSFHNYFLINFKVVIYSGIFISNI